MGHYIVCLVTIDDIEKGARIARMVVEKKLAACVNIVPQVRSIYTWNGRVCDELESLMIIKTRHELFAPLKDAIKEMHPYEVPEIISLTIDQGLPQYLKWIDESTTSQT